MEKTYVTKQGYEKLKQELDFLKTTKRIEITRDIAEARAHGDLKENAEYHAAREAQGLNEARLIAIETKLATAVIINEADIPTDAVYIGATVELLDVDFERKITYTLVPEADSDFASGKISITSPIAKALLGGKIGEVVEVIVPARTVKYKILNISR
jgi:transcription elongation factor GreA